MSPAMKGIASILCGRTKGCTRGCPGHAVCPLSKHFLSASCGPGTVPGQGWEARSHEQYRQGSLPSNS